MGPLPAGPVARTPEEPRKSPLPLIAIALVVCAVLGLPVQAEDKPAKPGGGVTVLCEIWHTGDAALVKELEALSEKTPADATAIHKRLAGAGRRAARACRFQTSTAWDTPAKHTDSNEMPQQAPRGGFGGFVKSMTELSLTSNATQDGQISTSIRARITGPIGSSQAVAPGTQIPPGQGAVKLESTVKAGSGAMRMFSSITHESHTTYVFVTSTKL